MSPAVKAFRAAFDCLWCGRPWQPSGESDLTGWALLCADCLDRAQDNGFLRSRLRTALRERSAAATGMPEVSPGEIPTGHASRLATSEDWYLRRGRHAGDPARDLAWHADLETVTTWLDAQPLRGSIVELAAGAGWWSPLLASKGELTIHDTDPAALDRARERLVAHGLRAHIHVRDPWAEPDRQVDGVFCGFLLGSVPDEWLLDRLALIGRWLRPGGRFAFVDVSSDQEPGVPVAARTPTELATALGQAGFADPVLTSSARSFVMGSAMVPHARAAAGDTRTPGG